MYMDLWPTSTVSCLSTIVGLNNSQREVAPWNVYTFVCNTCEAVRISTSFLQDPSWSIPVEWTYAWRLAWDVLWDSSNGCEIVCIWFSKAVRNAKCSASDLVMITANTRNRQLPSCCVSLVVLGRVRMQSGPPRPNLFTQQYCSLSIPHIYALSCRINIMVSEHEPFYLATICWTRANAQMCPVWRFVCRVVLLLCWLSVLCSWHLSPLWLQFDQ